MTIGQREAICAIAESLKCNLKNHPSMVFRESFDPYTEEEIEKTVDALRMMYATNDGIKAYKTIKAEREGQLSDVVGLYLSGQL